MEGTIKTTLNKRCDSNDTLKELIAFINKVESNITDHLDEIVKFMPEFDCHSIKHSYNVLIIMEQLLGSKVSELSTLELFFMYTTALLHDCGMALSIQEEKILKACEGDNEDFSKLKFGLDGKPKANFRLMKELIFKYRKQVYGELIDDNDIYTQKFIFGFQNEDKFVEHLAAMAIKYQSFRNGRLPNIRKKEKNSIEETNEILRQDFIRYNHASLSEIYCENIANQFNENLLFKHGTLLAKTIGVLCHSHDMGFKEAELALRQLPNTYFDNEKADLVFISAMLRVADILHFNSDRVSESLSFEKGTNHNIHWRSKLTGLKFVINHTKDMVEISAIASCSNPEEYYFIKNYIKYVESEIANLIKCSKTNDLNIKIYGKVNSKGLISVSNEFIPADDLCIKMDQSHIVGLLMGDELYKDKFACLRELYQNSLDACRCKQLTSSHYIEYNIEFGIDKNTKHGIKRSYLYCLDNGIGMDLHIIQDYLLHVGHTFYSSSEFNQMRTDSGKSFYPVSQFGVGILSCFMLCDLLEITTKKENSEPICLTIDGKNEYLYFSKPKREDIETIGNSGTLVKLFLKEHNISDEIPSQNTLNEIFMYQSANDNNNTYLFECDSFIDIRLSDKTSKKGIRMAKEESLYLITLLTKYIKLYHHNINVIARCVHNGKNKQNVITGEKYNLIYLNSESTINMAIPHILQNYIVDSYRYEYVLRYINPDNVIRREITIPSSNLQYRNILFFPKDICQKINYQSLLFARIFEKHKAGFLIDGILVKLDEDSPFYKRNEGDYSLNFIGEVRPKLSVDRLNVLNVPKELENQWQELKKEVAKEEIRCICDFLNTIPEDFKTEISNIMWKYYFISRRFLYPEIIDCIIKNGYEIYWNEVYENVVCDKKIGLYEFLVSPNIVLKHNTNYFMCSTFYKTIISYKLSLAKKVDISEVGIMVYSPCTNKPSNSNLKILTTRYGDYKHCVYKRADYSETIYRQYDIVNSFLPLINNSFFDILSINNKLFAKDDVILGNDIKDNDIHFIYDMDSMSIYNGVMYRRMHASEYQLKYLLQGKFINGPSKRRKISNDKSFLIYCFVTSNLTDEQKQYVQTLKDFSLDYYNGAINGWSVLYTEDFDIVALPGIHDIKELLIRIPDSYWANTERKTYLTNNDEITFEMVQKLRKNMQFNM